MLKTIAKKEISKKGEDNLQSTLKMKETSEKIKTQIICIF